MSIKPVAMIPEDELKHIEDRRTALVVPVCDEWSDRDCVMLYAIPDTHRVVPVELLEDLHRLCTEQAWWTIYREKAQKLQAIIDKVPT